MGRRGALALLVLVLCLGSAARAGGGPEVPEAHQVPILYRLLTYDRTLMDRRIERLRIGLLHRRGDAASQRNLTAMVEVLTGQADKTIDGHPFEFILLPWDEPERIEAMLRAGGVDVLYVTAGHEGRIADIGRVTRELGVLSLAGVSAYVAQGLSVGLGLEEGRPRILVNRRALREEGHDLDARVLRLCKVVREP